MSTCWSPAQIFTSWCNLCFFFGCSKAFFFYHILKILVPNFLVLKISLMLYLQFSNPVFVFCHIIFVFVRLMWSFTNKMQILLVSKTNHVPELWSMLSDVSLILGQSVTLLDVTFLLLTVQSFEGVKRDILFYWCVLMR